MASIVSLLTCVGLVVWFARDRNLVPHHPPRLLGRDRREILAGGRWRRHGIAHVDRIYPIYRLQRLPSPQQRRIVTVTLILSSEFLARDIITEKRLERK